MGDHHVHLHPHGPWNQRGPQPGTYPPGHLDAFVEAGIAAGADEVGFTEHLYRCVEAAPVLGPFWEQEPQADLAADTQAFIAEDLTLSLDRYVEVVVDAKDRGLPVALGLEVDYFPDTIDAVLELLAPYPFDFLIGSVHWIGGWAVDYVPSRYEFERRGVRRAYEDYFHLESELARSGVVDVLAHIDVVKKAGFVPDEPPIDLYEAVVAAAVAGGVAVELSSAGLYKACREVFPAPDLLAMLAAAKVPLTLASDAHHPHETARDRAMLIEMATAAGYTERVRFDSRVRHVVPLQTVSEVAP